MGIGRDAILGAGQQAVQGREDAHGRLPQVALRVERREQDGYGECTSFLYGQLLGGPLWHPQKGVQFIFSGYYAAEWDGWRESTWLVTIHGEGLRDLWQHVCQSKLEFVAVGERVTDVTLKDLAASD